MHRDTAARARSGALLVSLALLLAACAAEAATSPSTSIASPRATPVATATDTRALPTFQTTVDGVPVACAGVGYLGEVTIHGSAGDSATTWIVFKPGGRRENLLWPAGYRARFAPAWRCSIRPVASWTAKATG